MRNRTDKFTRARARRLAKGQCWYCTNPAAEGSRHQCERHLAMGRLGPAQTKWVPGGVGRPPVWAKQKAPAGSFALGSPTSSSRGRPVKPLSQRDLRVVGLFAEGRGIHSIAMQELLPVLTVERILRHALLVQDRAKR